MMAFGFRLLLVDDELAIRRALRPPLIELGFEVVQASQGEEAIQALKGGNFDVVLLDINMPGIGGIETLRRIRTFAPRIPVLMLTVRDGEAEKVEAFDTGADDYVTKPFSTRELIARIRTAIRESKPHLKAECPSLQIGDICLIPRQRLVTRRSQPIHLTRKEFDLLHILMQNAGRVVTYSKLLSAVWGESYREEVEYLRTFVRTLRKKLCDDPSNPAYILTDIFVGYRFVDSQMLLDSSSLPARESPEVAQIEKSYPEAAFVSLRSQ